MSARGATVLEALVALGIAALVLTLAFTFHEHLRRSFRDGEDAAERQHSARVALDWIEADLRLAGFGVDPDGDPARPDEPIEAAAAAAIVVRADFDVADAAAAADPERALEGSAFEHVSTGNDEIHGFVLRPMRGVTRDDLAFDADVTPAPRDGIVEPVVLDGIAQALDAPPYALYRVALDADAAAYGSSGFAHFTPIVENVRALRFRYFDHAGREIAPPGGSDTAAARSVRAAIAQVGLEIEVLSADPDPRWLDVTDPDPRTRRMRKLRLSSRVLLRNGPLRAVRPRRARRPRARERGIALVVVLCIAAAAGFVALAIALIAESENLSARNEKRASQARWAAEAGARVVQRWFDEPRLALHVPGPGVVDRTRRRIRNEADPEGPPLGSTPWYKQGVDADADGADDLFDRPFDGSVVDALRGTLDGPDVRIDRASRPAAAFLDRLSASLFATFPDEGGGMRTRISRIDLSAPTYLRRGPGWLRRGIGTVRVTARLEQATPTGIVVLAQRTIETLVAEIPYRTITGPVHSCAESVWTGPVGVHWGTFASVGSLVVSGVGSLAQSVPRSVPPDPIRDPVWNLGDPAAFGAFLGAVSGVPFPDPWFRVLSGADVVGAGAAPGVPQPFPPDPAPDRPDRSNLFQARADVTCPALDYETVRSIARSGRRGVHYFEWDGGAFREDGAGPRTTLADALRGRTGLYFFDTVDGELPRDGDGDGILDNLTPPQELDGPLVFRGLLYANASSIRIVADPSPGAESTLRPPGEPYQDLDRDGQHDAGEQHLDLVYPTASGNVSRPIVADRPGGQRDARGAPILGVPVALDGILITSGRFEATGRGAVYGSIVALSGISQAPADGSAPTPDVYWNASIAADWPPSGWGVPRVMAVRERFDP